MEQTQEDVENQRLCRRNPARRLEGQKKNRKPNKTKCAVTM